MSPLGYPAIVIGQFRLNMYTLPAYLCLLLCLVTMLLMAFVFKEFDVGVIFNLNNSTKTVNDKDSIEVDIVAAISCIWCRFVTAFCFVYDDTIASILTMIMFNWSRSQALQYNGLINVTGGIFNFVSNIFIGTFLLKHIKERNLMILGLFSFLMFYVVSFSYPGLPVLGEVTLCPLDTGVTATQSRMSTEMIRTANYTTGNHSCLIKTNLDRTMCSFEWCKYTTRIKLGSYVAAFLFFYVGFSCCCAPSLALFSKVLGQRRQTIWHGVNLGAQSVAYILSPITVSSLFESYGPRVAWLVSISILVVSIVFMFAAYTRLVPHKTYGKKS